MMFKTAIVTPDFAAQLLKANTNNRPISKASVRLYASEMRAGRWTNNGDTIRLSKGGRLLDGQHRLLAVISAGIPVQMTIVEGLDDDTFKTIDQGRKRTNADILAIAGEKNTNRLAAAARAVFMIERGLVSSMASVVPGDIIETLERRPEIRMWVSRMCSMKSVKSHFPASLGGLAALYAERYGSEVVESFLTALSDGAGLEKGNPALVLRERFLFRARGQSITYQTQLAFMIKAMNAYVAGKKLSFLRFHADEQFPSIA